MFMSYLQNCIPLHIQVSSLTGIKVEFKLPTQGLSFSFDTEDTSL